MPEMLTIRRKGDKTKTNVATASREAFDLIYKNDYEVVDPNTLEATTVDKAVEAAQPLVADDDAASAAARKGK